MKILMSMKISKKWAIIFIIILLMIIICIFRTSEILEGKSVYKKPLYRKLCDRWQGNFFKFRDCQPSNFDYAIFLEEDCIDREKHIIKAGTYIGFDNEGYPEHYFKSAFIGVDDNGEKIYHYYEDCKKFKTKKVPKNSATCSCSRSN